MLQSITCESVVLWGDFILVEFSSNCDCRSRVRIYDPSELCNNDSNSKNGHVRPQTRCKTYGNAETGWLPSNKQGCLKLLNLFAEHCLNCRRLQAIYYSSFGNSWNRRSAKTPRSQLYRGEPLGLLQTARYPHANPLAIVAIEMHGLTRTWGSWKSFKTTLLIKAIILGQRKSNI